MTPSERIAEGRWLWVEPTDPDAGTDELLRWVWANGPALLDIAEAAIPALDELLRADEHINGEHDICGMCESAVPLRQAIEKLGRNA